MMREIVSTLERNAREVQYGSASVELRIHDGKVVKTVYRTAKTKVTHNQEKQEEADNDRDG